MSHQKFSRIESPLKGKFHSMLIQNHQPTISSSRFTQKRKPIFEDTPNRSSVERSSSARRKIFSKTQQSKQKESDLRFLKLFQTQQLQKRQGENLEDQQIQFQQVNESAQSSSIESDSGLDEVKRQLFPATPIKKITRQLKQLQNGRQWLVNSSKNCKKQLFQDSCSPPKQNLLMSINNLDKTTFRFNYKSPQKIQKDRQERQDKKDIAKQLRQLHNRMMQKTRVYQKVENRSNRFKIQNEKLRQQNERLRQNRQKDMNGRQINSIQKRDDYRKMANENLYMKVKMQKAREILKKMLELKISQQEKSNTIVNIEQTLKQVIRQLQF